MRFNRSAGLLLHVTSLPGPHGIGDLGDAAYSFLDWLHSAGQSYWQILPLGPTSDGSPYVAQSSWAGSPWLLSLDALVHDGDLHLGEPSSARVPEAAAVNFGAVATSRRDLLARAAQRFFERGSRAAREHFEAFCAAEAGWLNDWALFAAVRETHGDAPWWTWPKDIALRTSEGVAGWQARLADELQRQRYLQFRFFEQWGRLRARAAELGIGFIGDIPIYCARDSADVWAARHLFRLDADGAPLGVSGVPPDYFAKDGQLWGSPVYDWDQNRTQGYAWWIERLRAALRQANVVRIDHFRAFEAYWEVPANAVTAKGGKWKPGPGDELFAAVRAALGDAPFIAEDLGIITAAVRGLRDRWEFPGMRVLQFAFGQKASSPHLPIRYPHSCVAYTGTHDNDTTAGWFAKASELEKDEFRRYTASNGEFAHYHAIRAIYASVADLAIVPMQDALGLGSGARMNTPGVATGNWGFKLRAADASADAARMLRELAGTFGRLPDQKEATDTEADAAQP